MNTLLNTLVFSCVLFHIVASALAQDSCSKHSFTSNKKFTTCVDLPVQNAFLHWTYNPTSHTADIAFQHGGVSASRWIAWGLNLDRPGMIGAQSLIAFKDSSGAMRAYTSVIKSYKTTLSEEPLSFNVSKITAEFLSSKEEMIRFASLKLPSGRTSFNQVWQEGPVSDGALRMHGRNSANLRAVGTIEFSDETTHGEDSNKHERNLSALLLRPNKDHSHRFYWNIYHHSVGYTIIILSIINIFEVLAILEPAKKWKTTYIGILVTLLCIAAILEASTWLFVLTRRNDASQEVA